MFSSTPITGSTLLAFFISLIIILFDTVPMVSFYLMSFFLLIVISACLNFKYIYFKVKSCFLSIKNNKKEKLLVKNIAEKEFKDNLAREYMNKINKNPFKDNVLLLIQKIEQLLSQNLIDPLLKNELLIIKDKQILQVIDNYNLIVPSKVSDKEELIKKTKEQLNLIENTINKIEQKLLDEQNHKLEVYKKYLEEKHLNL